MKDAMSNSGSTGWDWPWFYYAGTVILRMDEKTFWRTTPRKLNALLAVYVEIESAKNNGADDEDNEEIGFIDNIPGL